MPSVTRTVRFERSEAARIENFLQKNEFLDFSTLARLAISQFIQNPKLNIQPVLKRDMSKSGSKKIAQTGGNRG